MNVLWTSKALSDIARLHDFLASVNKRAATRNTQKIIAAVERLSKNPRIGEQLDTLLPHEVRRIMVGQYEVRYEVLVSVIRILRIWHFREHR